MKDRAKLDSWDDCRNIHPSCFSSHLHFKTHDQTYTYHGDMVEASQTRGLATGIYIEQQLFDVSYSDPDVAHAWQLCIKL